MLIIRGAVPNHSDLSGAGWLPGRMVAAGGPLRAKGFPKRRCQFEFVAAQPHLSPKKAMHDSLGFHA